MQYCTYISRFLVGWLVGLVYVTAGIILYVRVGRVVFAMHGVGLVMGSGLVGKVRFGRVNCTVQYITVA